MVPDKWRNENNFTITRLRSPVGLANRIMKESSVEALLVSVSVRSMITYDFFRTFDLSCRRAGWYKQGEQDL